MVGGTRFYDRREIKDAMAYLRAVVNPADEVSVKRVLNVPKRGIGDASVAKLDAFAGETGVGFLDALRRADEAGVTGPAVARHRLVRRPARRARAPMAGPTMPSARATCCRRRSRRSGYLAELEAEDTVESAGRLENLGELVGSAREFTALDEFLEQVALVADTDEHHRRRPGGADDAALGQGPGVPRRVPRSARKRASSRTPGR